MTTTAPPPPPPAAPAPGTAGPRRRRRSALDRPRAWVSSAAAWAARRRTAFEAWQARRPARPPRPQPQGGAAVYQTSSAMVAIVCLWAVAHLLFFGNVSHARAQDLLFHEYRSQLAALTAPTGPGAEAGAPVAMMTIPAIGLDEVVVEGTAAGDLMAGPGHLRTTVIPGQAGLSVVYGRSTTYGAPFGRIDELRPGDQIHLIDGQGEITMSVIGVRHDGDPLPPPIEEGDARLTLVTSEGHGPLAALSPGKTVFVDADASKGFPSPGVVNPAWLPPSEAAMARGTEALPIFSLCLFLLTVLVVAIVAARQRWSVPLVWVVAAPVAVALAWATTDAAMRLLPNLI